MKLLKKWFEGKRNAGYQKHLVDDHKDAFFVLDQNWRFTYINQEGENLLLKSRERLVGSIIWDQFPEAFRTTFYYEYNKTMAQRTPTQFQEYFPPLKMWFDVNAYPLDDGIVVHFRDMTKEKEELDIGKQHYKSLFDYNPDAIFSLDLHGRLVSINSSFEQLTGYTKDEILFRPYNPLIATEDVGKANTYFNLTIEGKSQNVQITALTKNGDRIYVSITCVPIVVNSETVGVYGIAKDITERVRQQEQLHKSEELHKLIAENSLDIICYTSQEGVIEYVSPAVYHLLGYMPEELMGKNRNEIIHPEDVVYLKQRPIADTDVVVCKVRHKNGSYIWFEISMKTIRNYEGEVDKILSVGRDISERVANEKLIRKSEKLSMAGQLAAGIAHEIRNPLTSVKGFIQLMQNGQDLEKAYLDIMYSEITRVEGIIQELLLLSKPNKENFSEKNIISILSQVITLMETEAILENVHITTELSDKNLLITCDDNQIKQLFINLIKNAIEAMPKGGEIFLHTYVEKESVVIVVEDTGYGIPKEILGKIGQPFYTTKDKGTGLGLAVCLNIIESHQGKLEIESEMNKGTIFTVKFPLSCKPTNPIIDLTYKTIS